MTATPGLERRPDFSPDGTRIAFQRQYATLDRNVYSIRPDGTGELTLAGDPAANEFDPVYSPDGAKIAFARDPWVDASLTGSPAYVWTMKADGSGAASTGAVGRVPDWQPARQAQPAPGSIAGKVTSSQTKKAIAAARVDCGVGGSATTALDGSYRITGVPPATYTCTASATGS